MKNVELGRTGRIKITDNINGSSSWINVKHPGKGRPDNALIKARSFFADNRESILNLFGDQAADELDLLGNPAYKTMVYKLRDAGISEDTLKHTLYQLTENSTHSPELMVGRVIVDKFSEKVMTDAEQFSFNVKARKSATLSSSK